LSLYEKTMDISINEKAIQTILISNQ